MAFFFFFFFFFDDDDGRQFVPGEGGGGDRFECVWTNWCEGLGIGTTKKNTTARVLLESLSLSLDACPKLESSTTLSACCGRENTGLSLSFERKESV